MSAGLKKILGQIKFDATNQKLVDRYLRLVAEISDDASKVEHVLALAQAVIESDPFLCLQLSKMVFSFDPHHVEALELAVRALEDLGRFAKAEVLRNEMNRLREEFRSPPPPPESEDLARTVHIPYREAMNEVRSASRFVRCIELLAHGWHREALFELQQLIQQTPFNDDEWNDAAALTLKIWETQGRSIDFDPSNREQLYRNLLTTQLVNWT